MTKTAIDCNNNGRTARIKTMNNSQHYHQYRVSSWPWPRHQTQTAPDELAVTMQGWRRRWCVNVWMWVNVRQYCKALWVAIYQYRCCAFYSLHTVLLAALPIIYWFFQWNQWNHLVGADEGYRLLAISHPQEDLGVSREGLEVLQDIPPTYLTHCVCCALTCTLTHSAVHARLQTYRQIPGANCFSRSCVKVSEEEEIMLYYCNLA